MVSRRIEDMPADEYHAIKAANASSLKTLRSGTVSHMLAPRESKSAFDLGTAIHSLVLEGLDAFRERHPIRPKHWTDWRSKDAREWKAEREAEGCVVITPDEAEIIRRIGKELRRNEAACLLLERSIGRRELTYLWTDPAFDVPCKCRFDAVALDGELRVGVDLKSARTAIPRDFARAAVNFGYDLQFAHYDAGFHAVEGVELDAYAVIVVETSEPFGVATYQIGPDWLERGRVERDRALSTWADWYHDGAVTPATVYPTWFQELELPAWA